MSNYASIDEEVSSINEKASRFYDLYEKDEGQESSFWLEYQAHMSQPVDETENLMEIVDFVGQ